MESQLQIDLTYPAQEYAKSFFHRYPTDQRQTILKKLFNYRCRQQYLKKILFDMLWS